MHKNNLLLIDFDSTFVAVESLNLLADIVLERRADRQEVLDKIVDITRQGMEGKITFSQSLTQRLELFKPSKKHIEQLVLLLHKKVTKSFKRNKEFFKENAERIYILSGGFKEYMIPVLRKYGILENHILGNTLLFDNKRNVIGYDRNNPLAKEKGKVKMIEVMKFDAPLIMVGDGYTDYEIKQAGLAKTFIAFIENVERDVVIKNADVMAKDFEEVLKNI